MELLKSWILNTTGAAVLSAICLSIVPEGRGKKALTLVCGMVTLLCLAYPLADGSISEIEGILPDFRISDQISEKADETEQIVTRTVIEAELEAYILDKGEEVGVVIRSADVSVRWNTDGFWYPTGVEIYLQDGYTASHALTDILSKELGIDPNNIYWS